MELALAELVWERARRCCEYCRMPQTYDELPFEIDHVIAEQHGGKTVASNLALACFADNHHKGPNLAGIDPKTRRRRWLFNPRRHKWSRHFRWDGPILVGRTAIGRATIAVLRINLAHRVRHRAQLIAEGIFAPEESAELP
jgi:HNH endonuclease